MSDVSSIQVFYEHGTDTEPLLLVRSIRGGSDVAFLSPASAGAFASHEDGQQAWNDVVAERLEEDGVLFAAPDRDQTDVQGSTLMRVVLPGGLSAYFGRDGTGEPCTGLEGDRQAALNALPGRRHGM